jgi:hypothetical protein
MVDEMKWFWNSFLHGSWKTGPHQMTYYDRVLYGGLFGTGTAKTQWCLNIRTFFSSADRSSLTQIRLGNTQQHVTSSQL